MSTVTRENIGLLHDKITVKVQKEDYLPTFEKALKNYSKTANIPGFRKGMVPTGMIKKMYGPSIFVDEVLRSVEKGLYDYLAKEQLNIFAQPLPSKENDARRLDMNNPGEYTFSFEIGLKPEFNIDALEKGTFIKYKVKVTDEMLNQEIERLQNRYGKMTEPSEVTTEDNVLNVEFEACDKEGNVAEGAAKKANSLLVKYFKSNIRQQLMGKKVSDVLVIQLGDAFEEKELEFIAKDLGFENAEAGKREYFKITIVKLGLVEKRELNEEFFNELYPGKDIKTEAEFREAIKADINKYWEGQSRNQLHDQIFHALVDDTKIELPEAFLKRWLAEGRENNLSAEQADQEYPRFHSQLKWTLITDKIVQENGLQVTAEDIRHYSKLQMLGYYGIQNMDNNMSWLDQYVDKLMADQKYVEETAHRLMADKVFTWAETKVSTQEKEISAEEFSKLQEEHQHHHH
jgi:trigger factor